MNTDKPFVPTADQLKKMNIPLENMRPGEQFMFQVKRHPIGIITTYLFMGFILLVLAIIAFAVVPMAAGDDNRGAAVTVGVAIFLLATILVLLFSYIANKVYWGNSWVLTSDSITQVQQTSLFNKQSSQLSLANLEDVTAEQNGILTHMFNFGLLKCETAGERSKFSFTYCPDPNFYAQKILQAREEFEQAGRYEAEHYSGGKQYPQGSSQFPDSSRLSPQGSGSGVTYSQPQSSEAEKQ